MELSQITSLLTNWQGLLVIGMLCIISMVALFLLSRSAPNDTKVALQTLIVIRSVLAVKLGRKGVMLVDAWIAGLEQIKDGEFSNESVSIQLGSQDFVGGAVRWKPEVLFNPKTMRKVDIRTSKRLRD